MDNVAQAHDGNAQRHMNSMLLGPMPAPMQVFFLFLFFFFFSFFIGSDACTCVFVCSTRFGGITSTCMPARAYLHVHAGACIPEAVQKRPMSMQKRHAYLHVHAGACIPEAVLVCPYRVIGVCPYIAHFIHT